MLTEPVHWLVRGIAHLPDAARPGVFLVVVVGLVWLVIAGRGIAGLWHATCRGVAQAGAAIVGAVLLPEYLITTARRRRGEAPGTIALAMTGPAESALGGAAALYERHEDKGGKRLKPPWKPAVAVMVASVGAWVTMDRLEPGEPAKRELAKAYEVWRDVEGWADVDPTRRAGAGEMGKFDVTRSSRDGVILRVTVRCPGYTSCAGAVTALNAYGTRLATRPLALDAGGYATVRLQLSIDSRASRHGVHAGIDQT